MAKKIIITEHQLNVIRLLEYYANNRSTLVGSINNLMQQIAENWCLLKYLNESQDESKMQLFNHWASELMTYLIRLSKIQLKGNNTPENRYIAFSEGWDNGIQKLLKTNLKCIDDKFTTEQIDLSNPDDWVYCNQSDEWLQRGELVQRIKQDFLNSKDTILQLISTPSDNIQQDCIQYFQEL